MRTKLDISGSCQARVRVVQDSWHEISHLDLEVWHIVFNIPFDNSIRILCKSCKQNVYKISNIKYSLVNWNDGQRNINATEYGTKAQLMRSRGANVYSALRRRVRREHVRL